MAFDGREAGGLVNCSEGFSTFACRPLVNVHDLVVAAGHRGRRVGEQMLAAAEHIARTLPAEGAGMKRCACQRPDAAHQRKYN